ncbi:MAG: hypothetical protein KGJ62_05415 [Armatimonadetes bacterium]|nr:hypothetical protein [Armatimonadota bacterium]MDE2206639.1 hypothetical protein [Armatimonadota bacterium]
MFKQPIADIKVVPQILRVTLTAPGSRKPVETLLCTRQHPFYVAGKGFLDAGELALGTSIITGAGPKLVVSRLDVLHRRGGYTVYNLIVDGVHDYFVGQVGGGVEVHNGPSGGGGGDGSHVVGRSGDEIGFSKGYKLSWRTEIGGRWYSGHALDKMLERGIPPSAIENMIQNCEPSLTDRGALRFMNDELTVHVNPESGQVISAWRVGS